MLIFCMVLIFGLILTTFCISFICWIDDKKSYFEMCGFVGNLWSLHSERILQIDQELTKL